MKTFASILTKFLVIVQIVSLPFAMGSLVLMFLDQTTGEGLAGLAFFFLGPALFFFVFGVASVLIVAMPQSKALPYRKTVRVAMVISAILFLVAVALFLKNSI